MLEPGAPFDRYVVEGVLGEGGMGTVYRARDARLERRVALKVVRMQERDPAAQAEATARLLREARAAAALGHPNAVAIFDVGEFEGAPFIAMELVAGRSLAAILGDGIERVSLEARIAWLADIARVLDAAHRVGIVHRDIKPDNVMIRDDGSVKVLDFGIARRTAAVLVDPDAPTAASIATLTGEGIRIGTPRYMAPEQIRARPLDGRADQFAWGVLAYELLTGDIPWDTSTLEDLLVSVLRDEPRPLRSVEPAVPEIAEATVQRALAKDPALRFASMDEIVRALDPRAATQRPPPSSSVAARSTATAAFAPTREAPAPLTTNARAATELAAAPAEKAAPAPSRRRWLAMGALGAAIVAGAAALALGAGHSQPQAPAPSVASVATGGPEAPTPITKLAPPTSSSREALAEHAAALGAFRDASWSGAGAHLGRVVELDPGIGIAHARYALTLQYDGAPRTRVLGELRKALEQRSGMSERDRDLLHALEAWIGEPTDEAEAVKRLAAASDRRPGDAELAALAAFLVAGDPERSLSFARRALAIDPGYADVMQTAAFAEGRLGRLAEARTELDHCVELAPSATDCIQELSHVDDAEGRCDLAFEHVKRAALLTPSDRHAAESLTAAMFAAGKPVEAVRQSIAQQAERTPEAERASVTELQNARLAAMNGDFAEAIRLATSAELHAGSANAEPHADAASLRVNAELESGRATDAGHAAAEFLRQRDAWTRPRNLVRDLTPFFFGVAHRGGELTGADMRAGRRAWIEEYRSASSTTDAAKWAAAYGPTLDEAEDVAEAKAARPRVLHDGALHHTYILRARAGQALLGIGDRDAAIPFLRSAARGCFGLLDPFRFVQASFLLGKALEDGGDVGGACAAYDVVLARWGAAKPSSVTASAARDRSRALHCPKK